MNDKQKNFILCLMGFIFIIAVSVSSCESRGDMATKDLMFEKVGSGIR
jgi:hypothetical protein|tara:strand:- start:205 stop:348 length:144 start_codon:yes stop_codon:yes gene_type:complete